ncbi:MULTISPECIES: DUF1707 SHOCT-like domain-containing protein [unclassified Rhodococcus (in: high G+C Gram-positive bacteria)]|uniref:DUF1707 SHOCT-like domain-containing protein n=1 Tax=unclassified Rhodococcus (in: high G+C Gram-positive bacteria) TaxID=192944 RepID=UPI00146ECBC2|nr:MULTISPECIES: DUF1707 domain-containing protein [unclassified Rhodococcus (in: high G+C Gram-positive bacteria)]MBF0663745.1 DUF1707 domain-containing protein [Rhodococcus sp. (in: high G+C Gram-positive bacteria)]NMD96405.1 DUF1707 domain-containing protein [Rhodococcus sp. BL-253-APC-6A1W]
MTDDPNTPDILLSDSERLHALNVLSEHYAAGRLDSSEFYDRSGWVAQARSLSAARPAFDGLPGGVPLEIADGHVRVVDGSASVPAVRPNDAPAPTDPETELVSLRQRGSVVESLDWIIIGITLMTFLVLQMIVDWEYAWVVWPSLIVTLSVPRMILGFSDEDEELYEELKESSADERKARLREAAERIRQLESGDSKREK